MTRSLVCVTFGLAALAAVSVAAPPVPAEYVSSGEVMSVDASSLTVKETKAPEAGASPDAKSTGVERKFVVDAATKLTKGPQSIRLAEIRVGDRVTVRYVLDGGKNIAKSVEIHSKETEDKS